MSEKLNIFGRYSTGGFFRDGPTAFGSGGGAELVSLGGVSEVRNHSVAFGADYTLSPTLLADFRFGFFQYKVNVLPFDFGTTPALDAGIPGLNLGDDFTSGLPALFIGGDNTTVAGDFEAGSGLGVNRCNCPLDQNEKQWQMVGNLTKLMGNHSFKFGIDVRRAYNLRVPSDAHRSGELTFNLDRTRGPSGGGLGLATFLLGDVTFFRRYASPNTDARERQWRHFYYAQDTWRVNPRLTLNYGLRLDVINPQTVNEAGNGGWLDLTTGQMLVGGVGDVNLAGNVKNRFNWAPRLGVTYQLDEKTVLRAGYGRSYDIGVFGSLFGHSVTQNLPVLSVQELQRAEQLRSRVHAGLGPFTRRRSRIPARPGASRCRTASSHGRCPRSSGRRPSTRGTSRMQRQLTDTMSLEVAYVANHGSRVFAGDGPAVNANQARLDGFGTLNFNQRQPFFNGLVTPKEGLGGAFGWTQGIDYFCNCATNDYQLAAGPLHQAVQRRLSGQRELHAAARGDGQRRLLLLGSGDEPRAGRLGSQAQLRVLRSSR